MYLREIARRSETAIGVVQRELRAFVAVGLLRRTKHGQQVFFDLNRDHPAHNALAALLDLDSSSVAILRRTLLPLSSEIEYAAITENDRDSDRSIDLLLLGSISYERAAAALAPVEPVLKSVIRASVFSVAGLEKLLNQRTSMGDRVIGKKRLNVIGKEPTWLAKHRSG